MSEQRLGAPRPLLRDVNLTGRVPPGPDYPKEWDRDPSYPRCPVDGRPIEDDARYCSVRCEQKALTAPFTGRRAAANINHHTSEAA